MHVSHSIHEFVEPKLLDELGLRYLGSFAGKLDSTGDNNFMKFLCGPFKDERKNSQFLKTNVKCSSTYGSARGCLNIPFMRGPG